MHKTWGFPRGSVIKNPHAVRETWVGSLGWEDPLEEGMAAHSCIPAWRTPRREKPAGYLPQGCKELGQD